MVAAVAFAVAASFLERCVASALLSLCIPSNSFAEGRHSHLFSPDSYICMCRHVSKQHFGSTVLVHYGTLFDSCWQHATQHVGNMLSQQIYVCYLDNFEIRHSQLSVPCPLLLLLLMHPLSKYQMIWFHPRSARWEAITISSPEPAMN